MNDTAKNIHPVTDLSADGLDHIFKPEESSVIINLDVIEQADQSDPDQPISTTEADPKHWTLSEAADHLQVSAITIRRRLQKGTLNGYKVQGSNGPEWRVIPTASDLDQDSDQPLIIDQCQIEHPDQSDHTHPAHPPISDHTHSDHLVIEALLKRVSGLEDRLSDTQKELQGAVWRNGYLESQLTEREKEVKLLTDSQQESHWWANFTKWFF